MYAIGGNREAARLSGVPIKKVEIIVFTLSGALAAFAGLVLASRMYSGQPSVGSGYEMDAIAAAVIGGTLLTGGVGTVVGSLFGSLIKGIIETIITFQGTLSSWWTRIVIALLLCFFVILQSVFKSIREKRLAQGNEK